MTGSGLRKKPRRTGSAPASALSGSSLCCPDELGVAASEIFKDHLGAAERFAGYLAVEGPKRGLIGPREVPRLWDRHMLNCAVLAELMPAGATVADVGAGAGLPGMVLAIARPDLRLCLIEPMLRRTTWLTEVVAELRLPNVEVLRSRAESVPVGTQFDVVTARAVASLEALIPLCLPLVKTGGTLLAMKGLRASQEVSDAAAVLEALDLDASVVPLGEGKIPDPTMAVRVVPRRH